MKSSPAPIRALTRGPKHHFFGYYDKCPWSPCGRFLLAHQSEFMDRRPLPGEVVSLGLVDLQNGNEWTPFAQSRAWNWQQGAMLQWLPNGEVLFNDQAGDRYISRVWNPQTGQTRDFSLPVHHVSRDGRWALCCNYARLYATRPGYGYCGLPDPFANQSAPENDGVWLLDLGSGQTRLVIRLAELAQIVEKAGFETAPGALHWINHLAFNPGAERFLLLHRCGVPRFGTGVWWTTWTWTASRDGADWHRLPDDGMFSHYDWRDNDHVLAWASVRGAGEHFFLFQDQTPNWAIVAEKGLTCDGHCSYSPDRRFIASDEYPDANGKRALFVWDETRQQRHELGRFFGPFPLDVDIRCDLHARWNHDGSQLCIDSVHEGSRQLYVLDWTS